MTNQQIILVKRSWALIQQIDASLVADVFYSKLFADKPRLRKMFPNKMEEQYKKLVDMMSTVVARLDRLAELTADIEAMAVRHAGYGVKQEHYTLVGSALLWTLEKALGNDWTMELKNAWTECYSTLSSVMANAANRNQL